MSKKERLNQIVDLLDEFGIINVSDLANRLSVSEMTVRRDLMELENSGKAVRFHGGAQAADLRNDVQKDAFLTVPHLLEKRQIAKTCVSLLHDNDVIFIGSGTTTALIAKLIEEKPVMVVTNSFQVFNTLVQSMPERVILTGGLLQENSGAFVGSVTASVLKSMKFSAAFIGCSAIADGDVMVSSMEQGEIDQIALQNARIKVLVCDHSKFGSQDFFVIRSLGDFDMLVTDSEISDAVYQEYSRYTDVRRCDPIPSKPGTAA